MTLIDDREICVKCGKKFMPRLLKPLTICEDCHNKLEAELTERKSEVKVDRMVMPTEAEPQDGGWISVEDKLPEEGGRYLCWCKEMNDLGESHFFWNCYYQPEAKKFSDKFKPYHVTHWKIVKPPLK